jgi:hypothetical protein
MPSFDSDLRNCTFRDNYLGGAPSGPDRSRFTGLISGGVSAMAYALHCTDDSLPFVAVWYGGTLVLRTLAGAMLGSRLFHWLRAVSGGFTST